MKKKILFAILIFLIISVSLIYIFIPRQFTISNTYSAACIPKNIYDCLKNTASINRWWPGQAVKENDSLFIYKNHSYKFIQPFTDGAEIQLINGKEKIITRIIIIPTGRDSAMIEWRASLILSYNPLKRIAQYFEVVRIEKNLKNILEHLSGFADKTENLYGFPVIRTTFTDTILFATRFFTKEYPSVGTIYAHIHQLKEKIKNAGAIEKDFPMLNVSQKGQNDYETMIAICINKEIKGDKDFFISMMVPMKDRFLMTEVTGGPLSIKNAHDAIENYMQDHMLTAPAIPFEILITDRSKEADTTKWKTRLFHPSM